MRRAVEVVWSAVRMWLLVVAGAVLLVATHSSHAQIPLVLNDVTVFARPGQTVESIVGEYGPPPTPKVLSARDGRVVGEQKDVEPLVVHNGAQASPRALVRWGDEIELRASPDVIEPSRVETRALEVDPRTVGRGVTAKVLIPGVKGVERLTIGAVSGDVLATEVLVEPQPGFVRMVPAAETPLVALTFDDGPWPVQTEAILKILAEREVPATFFMLGSQVERLPAAARAVVGAGHVAGNHTYWHAHLDKVTPTIAASEIRSTNAVIQAVTGVTPRWLRPPAGRLGGRAPEYIASAGMVSALWTIDPQDWRTGQTAEVITESVVGSVRPGAIVVLHDGGGDRTATIAALPVIIDRLRAAGYEFVTLDELPAVRSSW